MCMIPILDIKDTKKILKLGDAKKMCDEEYLRQYDIGGKITFI